MLDVFADIGLAGLIQLHKLRLRQPDSVVLYSHINMRQAILGLINDDLAFILIHIFTPVLPRAPHGALFFCGKHSAISLWDSYRQYYSKSHSSSGAAASEKILSHIC